VGGVSSNQLKKFKKCFVNNEINTQIALKGKFLIVIQILFTQIKLNLAECNQILKFSFYEEIKNNIYFEEERRCDM
jgi:hypothetical protein